MLVGDRWPKRFPGLAALFWEIDPGRAAHPDAFDRDTATIIEVRL